MTSPASVPTLPLEPDGISATGLEVNAQVGTEFDPETGLDVTMSQRIPGSGGEGHPWRQPAHSPRRLPGAPRDRCVPNRLRPATVRGPTSAPEGP